VHDLKVGGVQYRISDSDSEIALSHAIGSTFIELQKLEFSIISYLTSLAGDNSAYDASFGVFASKTFGNLIHEMGKHEFLRSLANDIELVKQKRDFFVHKFLFHRYGGVELTTEADYQELIHDAINLGCLFAQTRTAFHDFMLQHAPLEMFAAKRNPHTRNLIIVESEFSKKRGLTPEPTRTKVRENGTP
jgi:hypothetical protein